MPFAAIAALESLLRKPQTAASPADLGHDAQGSWTRSASPSVATTPPHGRLPNTTAQKNNEE